MISHFLFALLWSGFAAFAILFAGINLGLRCLPAGRAFLAEARAGGRIFAPLGWSNPGPVKWIAALSTAAAIAGGALTWTVLRGGFG
ncbi:MAG: hypothetical protein AAGF44_11645 [Pseudomonadota bacterium]